MKIINPREEEETGRARDETRGRKAERALRMECVSWRCSLGPEDCLEMVTREDSWKRNEEGMSTLASRCWQG